GRADIGGAQSFHFWLQAWNYVQGSQPACCFDYAGVFAYATSGSGSGGGSTGSGSGSTGGAGTGALPPPPPFEAPGSAPGGGRGLRPPASRRWARKERT